MIRKHLQLYGAVQGVGFRYRAKYMAPGYGLTGWARNCLDGSVEIELQGEEEKIDLLLQTLQQSPYIDITGIRSHTIPLQDEDLRALCSFSRQLEEKLRQDLGKWRYIWRRVILGR